jgi:MFS family permease
VLGLLAGWLLTAALADRVRQSGRARRRAVAVLGATALAAAVVPAVDFYRNLYRILSYDSGPPNPYIDGAPNEHPPAVLIGIGLLAVAAAILIAVRGARNAPDRTGQEPVTSN